MKFFLFISIIFFFVICEEIDITSDENVDEFESDCLPDFVIPGPNETVEFRFPNPTNVQRTTEVDKENFVVFKVYNIPLPKGIAIYFRTKPYNDSKPLFVDNKYLDSGVNMKLKNGTQVYYEDEEKLFLNYRYQSILTERKCRSYDVWIRYPMSDMMKYGQSGMSKHGLAVEIPFYWGYVIRNLNQKSKDDPFFLYSENVVQSFIGMKRRDDVDDDDDDDDDDDEDWDDDDDDDDPWEL